MIIEKVRWDVVRNGVVVGLAGGLRENERGYAKLCFMAYLPGVLQTG